jgi:hypothetical protein
MHHGNKFIQSTVGKPDNNKRILKEIVCGLNSLLIINLWAS